MRVGYLLKRYPRYSETFIVSEILAHEAAGHLVEILSLRPPVDTHFQDAIAKVRSPVRYVPSGSIKASSLWEELTRAKREWPHLAAALPALLDLDSEDAHQALVLARMVRKLGIDHLHAHFATSATAMARAVHQITGVPYSFTAHAKDLYHEDVDRAVLRQKLADAAAIVTVSEFNLRFLRETFGADAERVVRIYNGLDLDLFRYAEPRERKPLVVAIGRLVEKKGFAELIDACELLAQRGRAFECHILGSGELEAELRKRIEAAGLAERVLLLGPRPRSEVIAELRAAAVHAAPCVEAADGDRDGLPTTLLEAMALGAPCVSTDVTGIPEVIRHGETGLVVAQRDVAGLAAALERLLDDAALRVRLAAGARALIEREFDALRNAGQLRALFERAIAQSRPAAA
jgi:glycosyltransferase involved in cell wall biosynthesis